MKILLQFKPCSPSRSAYFITEQFIFRLKTPPATPLFASLEMEADSCQIVFQRELPILQPVKTSRV
jgi:hypothetical protein